MKGLGGAESNAREESVGERLGERVRRTTGGEVKMAVPTHPEALEFEAGREGRGLRNPHPSTGRTDTLASFAHGPLGLPWADPAVDL